MNRYFYKQLKIAEFILNLPYENIFSVYHRRSFNDFSTLKRSYNLKLYFRFKFSIFSFRQLKILCIKKLKQKHILMKFRRFTLV